MGTSAEEELRFYASGVFRICMWAGLLVGLGSAVLHMGQAGSSSGLFVLGQVIMAAIFGWFGWLATTNALFIASMSQISLRQGLGGQLHCIRWVEVQGLKWENPGAICLALTEGTSVTLNMFLLSRRDRSALRGSVHRQLEGPKSDDSVAAI